MSNVVKFTIGASSDDHRSDYADNLSERKTPNTQRFNFTKLVHRRHLSICINTNTLILYRFFVQIDRCHLVYVTQTSAGRRRHRHPRPGRSHLRTSQDS